MEAFSPAITAMAVYVVLTVYKSIVGDSAQFTRWIPLIGTALGAVLGGLSYFLAPAYVVANDILTAIIMGSSSGLAATGANQVFKQLSRHRSSDSATKTTVEPESTDD